MGALQDTTQSARSFDLKEGSSLTILGAYGFSGRCSQVSPLRRAQDSKHKHTL